MCPCWRPRKCGRDDRNGWFTGFRGFRCARCWPFRVRRRPRWAKCRGHNIPADGADRHRRCGHRWRWARRRSDARSVLKDFHGTRRPVVHLPAKRQRDILRARPLRRRHVSLALCPRRHRRRWRCRSHCHRPRRAQCMASAARSGTRGRFLAAQQIASGVYPYGAAVGISTMMAHRTSPYRTRPTASARIVMLYQDPATTRSVHGAG